MILIKKDFWHVTKNNVRGWFSYHDKRNAKGFATQYGGDVVTEFNLGESLPRNVFDPHTEQLMTVAERVGEPTIMDYKIIFGVENPKLLMYCETLKQANDIVKILAQSQKKVYVIKCA